KQFPIRSTDTIADNGINLDITIGYAGYMVAGYALHRYNLAKKWKQLIYLLGIVGFIITIGGTSLVSINQGKQYPLFYEYLTPNIMASSLAAFLLIKERFKDKEFSTQQKKRLSLLSKYSFGVYLVHVLIRNVIWKMGINTTIFTSILSVPFLAVIIIAISVLIAGALMKM